MKRPLSALCGLCAVVGLLAALLIPIRALEPADDYDPRADWMVYSVRANEFDEVFDQTPPEAQFTDSGYGIASGENIERYTLATARPMASLDGFYLELDVEQVSLDGILALAIWDEPRMVADYPCHGSGWYTVIPLFDADNLMELSSTVTDVPTGQDGSRLLGDTIIPKIAQGEDGMTFTLEISGGAVKINGKILEGGWQATAFLETLDTTDFYVSATLISTGHTNTTSTMTLTRFGVSRENAYRPGTIPPPPEAMTTVEETTVAEPGTLESGTPSDRPGTAPETTTTRDPDPDESQLPNPGETGRSDEADTAVSGAPEVLTQNPISEESTEPVTTDEFDFYVSLYEKAGGCGSVVGSSMLVFIAGLAAAAYVMRCKKQ